MTLEILSFFYSECVKSRYSGTFVFSIRWRPYIRFPEPIKGSTFSPTPPFHSAFPLFQDVLRILVSGPPLYPLAPPPLCQGVHGAGWNGGRGQSLAQLDLRPWSRFQLRGCSPASGPWHPSRGAASSSSATRLPATGPGLMSIAPRRFR